MTGEMGSIDKNGVDSNGDSWPIHASIARQLKGELRPFDVYQGPYIYVQRPERNYKFWIIAADTDGDSADYTHVRVYEQYRDRASEPFYFYGKAANRQACKAARELMK